MQSAYHRLAHSAPKYAWWKALVAGVIGVVIYVIFAIVIGFGWLVIRLGEDPALLDNAAALLAPITDIDYADPLTLALLTVSVAAMIPALLIARGIMGPRPLGLLSSVAGRIRWRWLARCTALATGVLVLVFGAQLLIPVGSGDAITPSGSSTTLLVVVLALLLTPFQAAAEEYVFRGYLMQAIGGWLKHPAWAILLPVPIFTIGHTQYEFLALLDVALLAVVFGYLTWRTGGLEAAIALHVLNNTLIFVLGAFDLVDTSATGGSLLGLLFSVALGGGYTALVVWQAKRTGLVTTRTVAPPEPPMERWAPPASDLVEVTSAPRLDLPAPAYEPDVAPDSSGWAPPTTSR